jgi:hypothetical protein
MQLKLLKISYYKINRINTLINSTILLLKIKEDELKW